MSLSERYVEAGGVKLLVREAGAGPPVLLLHGFPQTGRCWRVVAERLASRARVIVPDLPGYGGSGPPPAYGIDDVTAILSSLLETLGASPATIVGHDWGGSIAFALALSHPERVSRLAVTNAPFRKLDLRRGFHFVLFNLPVVPEVAFRLAGGRIVNFILRAGSARKEAFDDAATKPYREAFADPERVRSALAYYRTITRRLIVRRIRPARGAAHATPRRIEAPTLIVWGMRDPALPPSILASIERDIPHAKVVRLADCGHFVPEECPQELAREIEAFLVED